MYILQGGGDPTRDVIPDGDRGNIKLSPVSFRKGGENLSTQGRGWAVDPRQGIPCCHPYSSP
jgi:hypothetical protein